MKREIPKMCAVKQEKHKKREKAGLSAKGN
jgi:hypothetical protein